MSGPLLEVRDLSVRFRGEEGMVRAVDGVSFDIPSKSTVALVGESGCGKSVTAHSIMRLLRTPPAEVTSGKIVFEGRDLLELSERQMRALRGAEISLIFQDPMSSLNPVYSVGSQLVEAFLVHGLAGRREARRRAIELLERVGFPRPEERFDDYPHELSGGMRQRVMIAMALACSPKLMIADEPTTALDMLASAQIGALLAELKHEHDMSLLLISHDIGQVAERADQVVVLYAGQVAERGAADQVLTAPRHPYTRGLIASIPPLRKRRRRRRHTPTRLPTLASLRGAADAPSVGCRFAPRCPEVFDRCLEHEPPLFEAERGWWARCFLASEAQPLPLSRPSRAEAGTDEGPSDAWENESGFEANEEALEAALEVDIEKQARESQREKSASGEDADETDSDLRSADEPVRDESEKDEGDQEEPA